MDNDGDLEIAIGHLSNSNPMLALYVFHHDGTIMNNWPYGASGAGGFTFGWISPVIADINNDDLLDVISIKEVGSFLGTGGGEIYALNNNASLLDGFPIGLPEISYGSVTISDIDNDNKAELIGGDLSGQVFIWELPYHYNKEKIPWGQFRHDNWNSGLYGFEPAPSGPVVTDVVVCSGDSIPGLTGVGENLHWYSDAKLTTLVYTGNNFNTGETRVGAYTYYVTQNISGSVSLATKVTLTILTILPPPVSNNVSVCEGGKVPDLKATGNDVKWYDNEQLTKLLDSGNIFSAPQTFHGTYIYYVTQSDFNCESRPDTVILTIKPEPRAPVSSNLLVLQGDMNQTLEAAGENIQWYIPGDSSSVAAGNSFNPGITEQGKYKYEVTQTILGCESPAAVVLLTVMAVPQAPVALDVTICEGEALPELTAAGENIRWYGDSMLTNLLDTGNSFNPVQTETGIYTYFVTQTISGFESSGNRITFTINPKPIFDLGKDTLISMNEDLILGPFNDAYSYHWNNGSEFPYMVLSGSVLGQGTHMISVTVIGNNICQTNDTLFLSVVTPTGMDKNMANSSIMVFPNPTYGQFYIKLSEPDLENISVKIINVNGVEIKNDKYSCMNDSGKLLLDLYSLPRGIYYINILTSKIQYIGKIILQ